MRARLIVALVLTLVLAGCGDDGVFSTTPTGAGESTTSAEGATTSTEGSTSTPTTAAVTTTTEESTTTTTVPAQPVWERVAHDESVFGGVSDQTIKGLAVGGPGLVAVGVDYAGGDADAAVWTSPDGLAWTRLPHDEAVFGGAGDQAMGWVAAGGPGLVAVGLDSSGGDWDAAVWTSPDGLAWTRVPHDEAVFGGASYQEMWAVAAAGPGVVAVGYDASGADEVAAVWVSADGLSWSRVPHDEAVFGGAGDQEMWRVVAGGPGLVAVGYDTSGGDWDAAVWTSADGLTWTRVPHDEAVFGGPGTERPWGVAAGGPGVVAVGGDSSGGETDANAAVWISPDGVTWTRVAGDGAVFGGASFQEMWAVAADGAGLVAVGYDASGRDVAAAVWVSADGITWSRVAHDEAVFGGPGDQDMAAVARLGDRLVVVGNDYSGGDWDAAAWVGPPTG